MFFSSVLSTLGLTGATAGAGAAAGGATSAIGGALTGISTAATIAGTAMGFVGQRRAAAASERAERARQAQADLTAARERRDIARRVQLARAESLANAVAQGAEAGSGLQGGLAQAAGQGGRATVAVNQNQTLGNAIFAANRDIAAGQTMASMGNAISGFGSTIANNYDMFRRVGTYYTTPVTAT